MHTIQIQIPYFLYLFMIVVFYFRCYTYCYYRVNHTSIDSCFRGCEIFEQNRTCNCVAESENYDNFNINECEMGCAYNRKN